MNGTFVSNPVLTRLSAELEELPPEVLKAALYVIENPREVGISTMREIARSARVKPNTLVRMARQIGFDGYDNFRAPFRDAIRHGPVSFPDRARWLQGVRNSCDRSVLYVDLLEAAICNIEETFAGISVDQLRCASEAIWASRNVYTLGIGVNHSNASNFSYLASTGMKQFNPIPLPGSTATDDLAWSDKRDVLIAITYHPYRTEVVEAVKVACEQGLTVIAISDSPASPIIQSANHSFLASIGTQQFFPTSVSTVFLLETLLSFVIAISSEVIIERVGKFHKRRHQLGIYQEEPQ